MEYTKPPLTYEQQADQLIARGLIADRDQLIAALQSVNYYRLSGYWFPFREYPNENFRAGTRFDMIWRRYAFDRRLRLLVMDGIERVEISVRTQLTYELSHRSGAFGYLDRAQLPNLNEDDYYALIRQLREQYGKSKERFANHFQHKYGDEHDLLPIWMVTELMTFGNLLTMIRGASKVIHQEMSKKFDIKDVVLLSWLRALNAIRNTCAHHSRLWNRELGYKPMIPNRDIRWQRPVEIRDNRVFVILTIIQYLMAYIAPQSKWAERLKALLDEYPEIPRRDMGFADNWMDVPMWSSLK